MHKLIALYKKPDDIEKFLTHFNTVHRPIIESIPGLHSIAVNKITGSPFGKDPELFMIVEMNYANKIDFNTGMTSTENIAAGRDIANFAKGLVTLVIAEA